MPRPTLRRSASTPVVRARASSNPYPAPSWSYALFSGSANANVASASSSSPASSSSGIGLGLSPSAPISSIRSRRVASTSSVSASIPSETRRVLADITTWFDGQLGEAGVGTTAAVAAAAGEQSPSPGHPVTSDEPLSISESPVEMEEMDMEGLSLDPTVGIVEEDEEEPSTDPVRFATPELVYSDSSSSSSSLAGSPPTTPTTRFVVDAEPYCFEGLESMFKHTRRESSFSSLSDFEDVVPAQTYS